jgi:hypothetical protein
VGLIVQLTMFSKKRVESVVHGTVEVTA